MPGSRRIAYGVSRFPTATETFVVREMNALVDNHPDVSIGPLMSLFPQEVSFLHPDARRWMSLLCRPSAAEGLRASGWWTLRRPGALAGAMIDVIRASWRSPRFLLRSLTTLPLAAAHARRLAGERPDHVHVHFASYPGLSAWLIGRLTGLPYSFTAHAYDLFKDQSLLGTKVAEAEFVVTISEFNRRFLADYGGGTATPVHVIHCGVDPARYAFRPRTPPTSGTVRALCVAALELKKGHAVLLDALAAGGRDLDRLTLDLVGDGPLREDLEEHAEGLGLAARVRFHGRLTEAQVGELLNRSDLFVLPSIVSPDGQMEGLPVALVEALACGVLAVSTRLSGIPELIRDGETGYLASPGDPVSLADSLQRAISEPIDPARGRSLVESQFDIEVTASRMRDLFVGAAPSGGDLREG